MSEAEPLRRGDVVWLQCDPSIGAEPCKTRTCVIVSNDVANRYGQTITVVPTQRYSSSRAARAFIVDLRRPRSNLTSARVANASMIMSYDRRRVQRRAGRISDKTQLALDQALALHLGLDPKKMLASIDDPQG